MRRVAVGRSECDTKFFCTINERGVSYSCADDPDATNERGASIFCADYCRVTNDYDGNQPAGLGHYEGLRDRLLLVRQRPAGIS